MHNVVMKHRFRLESTWPNKSKAILPLGWLFYLHGSLTAQTFITVIILSLGTFWMKLRPTLTRRTRIACKRPLRP